MRERNCIVMDGCMLMNKSPIATCFAKKKERKKSKNRRRKQVVTWCFTPSQPVQLYQGKRRKQKKKKREREKENKTKT